MSTLSSALDRIARWFQENDPDRFWGLEPGLSRDEIDAIAKDLPFPLPEEVYQLYQWRNGRQPDDRRYSIYITPEENNAFIFNGTALQPLQKCQHCSTKGLNIAIDGCGINVLHADSHGVTMVHEDGVSNARFHDMTMVHEDGNIRILNRLNLFLGEDPAGKSQTVGAVLFDATGEVDSVVFLAYDENGRDILYRYDNLTSFMLTLAAGYESGLNFTLCWHDLDSLNADENAYLSKEFEFSEESTSFMETVEASRGIAESLYRQYNPKSIRAKERELEKRKARILDVLQSDLPWDALWEIEYDLVCFANRQIVTLLLSAIWMSFSTVREPIEYVNTKRSAVYILGRIGKLKVVDALVVDALVESLQQREPSLHQRELSVRDSVAAALGSIGDCRAVQPLIWALSDADAAVRRAAAIALGAIGDRQAIPPLIGAFSDWDERVCEAAAEALVMLKATEALEAALEHKNANVRAYATWALRAIYHPSEEPF